VRISCLVDLRYVALKIGMAAFYGKGFLIRKDFRGWWPVFVG